MDIRRYTPEDNAPIADLFADCFVETPNIWAFAESLFSNPAFKLGGHVLFVAESDGQIVGFSHGGTQGIYCVGVRPSHRRQGIGRKLVAALKLSLGPTTKFDWQCRNPFWGNAVSIRTAPFGMVEGIGLQANTPYAAFFEALGGSRVGDAVTFGVDVDTFNADKAREKRQMAEAQGFEFGLMQNRAPAVGSLLAAEQDNPAGRYFTATALYGQIVVGRCVGFAQPELGAGRFGIWDLEVTDEHRRKGVGAALVWNAMLEMQSGAFDRCEVTAAPHQNPDAEPFYTALGFTKGAKFALFE
ncbi:GNAT family N-acetyltransferase [Planctomycetota bacterium]|nr:GNAT family N-acetyltransferase [Planctomycetota bacterium]